MPRKHDYQQRVNRVLGYIAENLGGDLARR